MLVPTVLLMLIVAGVWLVVVGLWYLFPVLYIIGGVVWIAYETRLPFTHQSMACVARNWVLMLVLWPPRAANEFIECLKLRFSDERFVVVGDHEISKFGRWQNAVDAAKYKARQSQEQVMISDASKFTIQLGRIQRKSWFVEPDGSVNPLPK